MIFANNSYQKSVYLNSSNEITGRVYAISGNVLSYFGLRQENVDLLEKNAELQSQISELKNYIYNIESDSLKTQAFLDSLSDKQSEHHFIIARVVNNSISQLHNYIIINKGLKDGVEKGMGVISQKGVVGEIKEVSTNFAGIQPLLNPNSLFSCKVLNSNAAGTLVWDGSDPRYATLTEYPRYEKINKGDTIVTSGFSDVFPEGVLVGTIEDYKNEANNDSYSLKVKLSTDFGALKNVLLFKNTNKEKKELENKLRNVKQ